MDSSQILETAFKAALSSEKDHIREEIATKIAGEEKFIVETVRNTVAKAALDAMVCLRISSAAKMMMLMKMMMLKLTMIVSHFGFLFAMATFKTAAICSSIMQS